MLFGTLIETGTGLIHAFNERVATVYRTHGAEMPRRLRPLIAVIVLTAGWLLSRFGIIALIARGYGFMTWFFIVVLVIPLLTLGAWKIRRPENGLLAR
jgi:uncharacterized membrane protein YkvI